MNTEKKKILSVIGTRPEAIKMAPVIKELSNDPDQFISSVCVTGQHREMLDQVLELFDIAPDHDLNLMKVDQSLSELTASLFTGMDRIISSEKPDWILAQGDTTTVLVSSLVAFYHKIPFGHVEAGLRTGDKYKPFPEEINRRVADIVASAFFAPTERSKDVLMTEGVSPKDIYVTGNTVIDALLDISQRFYTWDNSPLAKIPQDKRIVLITAHRRESFGEPFKQLCAAIQELAQTFAREEVHFVYPVHLNPNVQQPVYEILSGLSNVHLIKPLDYLSLVQLMKRSTIILTDSGGIQEEAPSLKVPVLVMRDTTERPEGVEAGVVRLVGTSKNIIVQEAAVLLNDPAVLKNMTQRANPYGDGKAAARIVSILKERCTP